MLNCNNLNCTFIYYFAEYRLTKKLFTTIPRLSTEWFISFDLTIFSTQDYFINLIRFTIGGNNNQHGDRIPAVFQNPGSRKLHFTSSIGDRRNYVFNSEELSFNVKHHIEIDQTYYGNSIYRFNVEINGQNVLSTINSKARQFYNVQIWASDPWYHILANDSPVISNLTFVNFL